MRSAACDGSSLSTTSVHRGNASLLWHTQAWESAEQHAQRLPHLKSLPVVDKAPQAAAAPAATAAAAAPTAQLRFTAEAVLGAAHVFAADGILHSLPPALCEVLYKPFSRPHPKSNPMGWDGALSPNTSVMWGGQQKTCQVLSVGHRFAQT